MCLSLSGNPPAPQQRIVYAVPTPRRERTPPQGPRPRHTASQPHTRNTLLPNSPPHPQPSLLPNPGAYHSISPRATFPLLPHGFQYPPNSVLGHPNTALVQPHPGAPLSVPHAMSVPYRHPNPFTHPRMVTRLPHLLPHTAAKSPAYRQYQRQPPLFQHPPPGFSLTSTASDTFTLVQPPQQSMQGQYQQQPPLFQPPPPGFSPTSTASDTFTLVQPPQQSMQGQYATSTPGLPNRAPPTYSRELTQQPPARKRKNNPQKAPQNK